MSGRPITNWTFLVMTPDGIERITISKHYWGQRLTYADAQRLAMAKAQRRYNQRWKRNQ